MTDKKEVSILLLGIVAILAIVGLVLLFTSPAATGKASYYPPAMGPEVQAPAAADVPIGGQISSLGKRFQNAVLVQRLEAAALPRCPNGEFRTREQGNIPYEAMQGHYCAWFYCPGGSTTDPATRPLMACQPIPR